MRTKKIKATALTLTLLAAAPVLAEEETTPQSDENTPMALETMKVQDTAFQASVRSISQERLDDMMATDVKDILKMMPSVSVAGNARYSQKVYIRGLEDKFSNITIDGARITGQLFHHSGDQTIDAELLKLGEVELGPNSALSGPGVINGSFVYETKDATDLLEEGQDFGARVSAGYQSGFERKMGSVSLYGAPGETVEFLLYGNIVDDDTLKTPAGDEDSKESQLKSGLAKIVIKPSDVARFDLSYNIYSDGGDRNLSPEKPDREGDSSDYTHNEIDRNTIAGKFSYNPNDFVDFTTKIYNTRQQLDRDPIYGESVRDSDSTINYPRRTYENSVTGVDVRNSSQINDFNILTYGVDYSHEEQDVSTSGLAVYVGGDMDGQTEDVGFDGTPKVDQFGIYGEDAIHLDRWLFNLGARYDYYTLGGTYSGDFQQFSPKAKVSFDATDKLTLRAAYGRIFRGPALGETLMLAYYDYEQSDRTEAQTGNNFEGGFDYDLTDLFNVRHSLFGFTAYHYNVDNYAEPSHNSSLATQGDVKIWGLEAIFSLSTGKMDMNLSWNFIGGDGTDEESGLDYEPMTTQIHTFKLNAHYRLSEQLRANYNGQYVPSDSFDCLDGGSVSSVDRKSYHVHNLSMTYTPEWLKGGKLNFGVDNILDRQYTRHTAFGPNWGGGEEWTSYEVGRNFKVELAYKF